MDDEPTEDRSDLEDALALGHVLLDLGRPAEAVPVLARACALAPGSYVPRCLLAAALLAAERPDEALTCAEGAAGLGPDEEWPQRLRALALLQAGRTKPALRAARAAVALAPNHPSALLVLAQAQIATRHLREARTSAVLARALAPQSPDPLRILAGVELRLAHWAAAEVAARGALALQPEDDVALGYLGAALDRTGRHREAVAAYQAAGRLNPRQDAHLRRALSSAQGIRGVAVLTGVLMAGLTGLQGVNPVVSIVTGALIGLFVAGIYRVAFVRGRLLAGRRARRLAPPYPRATGATMRMLRREQRRSEFTPRELKKASILLGVMAAFLAPGLALVFAASLLPGSLRGAAGVLGLVLLGTGLGLFLRWGRGRTWLDKRAG